MKTRGNPAAPESSWPLLEAVPQPMVVLSSDGCIEFANERLLTMFGYARDELIGGELEILLPERLRHAHRSSRRTYSRDPRGRRMPPAAEPIARRKDGSELAAEITFAPIPGAQGALLAVVRELTADARLGEAARAGAHQALARQADVLTRFFTLSLDLICIAGTDGYFRRLSPGWDVLGYTEGELLAQPFVDFVHPDDVAATLAEVEKLARGLPTVHFENRYRCKDGSYRWLAWTSAPDPAGTLYAVARDITENKELEANLREAEREATQSSRFLSAIVENIPDMVFVKDAETLSFVQLNRAGEELLGLARAELIGKNDYDFFPDEEAEFFRRKDRDTLCGKTVVDIPEEPIRTAAGIRWLHTKKVPISGDDGTPKYLLGISEDITDRKRDAETRARLAAIVESSGDAIIGLNLDGVITSWNRAAERIFGHAARDVIGQPVLLLVPDVRLGEHAHVLTRLLGNERLDHFETVRRRKDGSEIDVSVSISPICDATGAIIGVSKIARDITEIKRVQEALERAKSAAEAANRELESFSYSIAHDLRAPLRSIDGFSRAVIEDCADELNDEAKKHLGFVRESAQHMTHLIDDLLMLSRVARSELSRETVDLSALARASITRLRRSQPERTIDIVIEEGLTAEADPRLLTIVLDNLLGNAWKFTAKCDAARVELGAISREGQVAYFVRDNGAGFDMMFANKLFGVFQRLHSASEFEGTGVGLATVERIVHRHGGRVWGEGEVDGGATFWFTLPRNERAAAPLAGRV